MGNVTKREIGAIRVFDTDTRFEISRVASSAFAAATAQATPGEPRIHPRRGRAHAGARAAVPGQAAP